MSFRLYDGAWVRVDGIEEPLQVHKDRQNAGVFIVGTERYDIDARALPSNGPVAALVSILSLQAVREGGLHSTYRHGFETD